MELGQWMRQLDWKTVFGIGLGLILALEQLRYRKKASNLPGPAFVVPFLGSVLQMINNPTKYWAAQALAARQSGRGLSWNVLLGRFVVFVRDSEVSQKIFANVKPDVFHLVGHPFGKKLFGEKNLIFMFGDEHKEIRRDLAPLFTLKALGEYVPIQEKTIRQHISKWVDLSQKDRAPLELRPLCRDLNLETSQNVFVGDYLTPQARMQFNKEYTAFNVGLLALPVYLPGFAFYKATKAVERLIQTLADCAKQSRVQIEQGKKPSCLVDFWMVENLANQSIKHYTDQEMGQHIFDFLFAAQDASTSSLVWVGALLESHPKVLDQVREEQRRLRPDPQAPITPDHLRQMKYTEMVVKEVLRFRPPAPLVPHIAGVDFALTDFYTVPKGTIVFPSVLESSFQGFRDPYSFDPDRFSAERQEDQIHKRNWLLFGAGPHQCPGQRYAINHLMIFTALFSTLTTWSRARTPDCDDLQYVPTIIPKDGCLIHISAAAS